MKNCLYTIGHSTLELDAFINLLKQHQIQAVADVRSSPYSGRFPHFNRENISRALKEHEIQYVFLGQELGARRAERSCYIDGQAKYELIAETPLFDAGIQRVLTGLDKMCIALMCSEKDPITCHRTVLVCRHLKKHLPEDIKHILSDGSIESHTSAEKRMMRDDGQQDMFAAPEEILERAYKEQGEKIAYKEMAPTEENT